ncbi:pseudouridine-5'-phosphate glycosidase [Austwickia chelonae]|uniref:Pseudouridine-5'-phosphate glycosidase n=1 Tax=Austwickia chelonae NBRC 105200 TaxID=1184607 RepID=K6WBC2_9MICO|nr:pseudouridine-5'-phosphate glycosidase [Austwickia chelonae]GAB79127.1 putative pseudouridine 5'-phosphate glycosidase [Austwickia chelonae NBRC 105200]SEW42499.1 pseudouridine-5'-phosphate glycosidase [Austwickia chelonae]
MTMSYRIRIAEDVRTAVAAGRPVLALESTILTHGLPRPLNLRVAQDAERLTRSFGVLPATVGVVDGRPTVGLSAEELDVLAVDEQAAKVSVRDLCTTAVARTNGGTTIAASIHLAHRAGVAVFATGGLGGVHRGASASFDESTDLHALSQVPVVVVCSGVKSVLDVRATLERLETFAVPVLGYRTDRCPGFYVPDAGFPLRQRADSPEEVADVLRAQHAFGVSSAVVVANPIPAEAALEPGELDRVLSQAWTAAERSEVDGQEATPFLLDQLSRSTAGRSVQANVALYLSNVRLGALVAAALSQAPASVRG